MFDAPALIDRLLAGIQAATLSTGISIFWTGVASTSSDHSFWTYPNLLAGIFYGGSSLRPDFGFYTLTGIALHLLLTTIFALIFSAIVPSAIRPWTSLLLGILAATFWFYLIDGFFFRPAFPPLSLYSRRPSIFFAFVLMGICVGLYSVFVRIPRDAQTPPIRL